MHKCEKCGQDCEIFRLTGLDNEVLEYFVCDRCHNYGCLGESKKDIVKETARRRKFGWIPALNIAAFALCLPVGILAIIRGDYILGPFNIFLAIVNVYYVVQWVRNK